MEEFYYLVSDGSEMDTESFISYILYEGLIKEAFTFCESDFSCPEAYNYFKNLFQ